MSPPSDVAPSPIRRLPEPDWPPHVHSGRTVEHYHRAFLLAATPALVAGTVLFGLRSLWVCGLAVAAALVGEMLCEATGRRHPPGSARRAQRLGAAAFGLLLGLTLPVSVEWAVPVVGGLVAVVVGKGLLGGSGDYLWHPALVGRAAVQLLFGSQVSPLRCGVLAKGHLLTGSAAVTADAQGCFGFATSSPPPGVEAWSMRRPVDMLAEVYRASPDHDPAAGSLLELFRDHLPPWSDTVWGHVAGGIGETCVPALLLGGLFLVHRGYIRWQLPVAAVTMLLAAVAIWPLPPAGGDAAVRWLPVAFTESGLPLGAGVLLFHLTGGGLWLGCVLLATDPISTPLTTRGQIVFGLGVGLLIAVILCNGYLPAVPGAVYWAILGMNTLVPLIDRFTSRRVMGTRRRASPRWRRVAP